MNAFGRLALVLVIGLLALVTGKAGSAADPVAGRSFARMACAYCHVVDAGQGFAPPLRPQGPDFSAVAAGPGNTAKRLRTFLITTHKSAGKDAGMPNPLLNNTQIDNVVSFIVSQGKQP